MALRPRSRPCTVPSPTSASGRKLRPLRGNPPSSFRFSRISPVEGSGFDPSAPTERGQGLSLRLSPHEPSFFDTEVFGLLPIGDRFLEQQREVTTKEGMLDETILIMVVDKSATITVNSQVRLGSLSS